MSRRYRLRMVEFAGTETFPQGRGLTWDTCVVELADEELIADVRTDVRYEGAMSHYARPILRVAILTPEQEEQHQ